MKKPSMWSLTLKNAGEILTAWTLIPSMIRHGGIWAVIREFFASITAILAAVLALAIVILAPLFFWLAPFMAYRQLRASRRAVNSELPDIWGDVCQPPEE